MDKRSIWKGEFEVNPAKYVLNGIYRARPMAMHSVNNEDHTRADPGWWLLDATGLYAAAEALAAASVEAPDYSDVSGLDCYHDTRIKAASLMLLGMSVEVILKGIIYFAKKYNPELLARWDVSDNNQELLFKHDLLKLSDSLAPLDQRTLTMLEVLTQFITWSGRYPSPKKKYVNKDVCQLRRFASIDPPMSYAEIKERVRDIHVSAIRIMHGIAVSAK